MVVQITGFDPWGLGVAVRSLLFCPRLLGTLDSSHGPKTWNLKS